ncbi:UNVERIFIED_CONTAM: Retrovirus-related Pol polyprotein from transposon gypsy [Sesamum indicum]
MEMAQKYIDEEEMNAMKDNEWTRDLGRSKGERSRDGKQQSEKDRERKGPYHLDIIDKGYNTEDCYQLRDEIERLIRQGYLKHLIDKRTEAGDGSRSRSCERHPKDEAGKSIARDNAPTKGVIHTISGGPTKGDSMRARKKYARESRIKYGEQMMHVEKQEHIVFGDEDLSPDVLDQNDPMVIKMDIANYQVHKVLINNGSSIDIIFSDVLRKMDLGNVKLKPVRTPLVGFGGSEVMPKGVINLPVSLGEEPRRKTCMVQFLVVDSPFSYNVVLGRLGLNKFMAMGETAKKEKRKEEMSQSEKVKRGKMERIEPSEEYKKVELISGDFQKTTCIGSQMTAEMETLMIVFLRSNNDLFAWSPSNFQGIDPEVIVHRLNIDPQVKPVKQNKRMFGVERNKIIEEEVNKLLQASMMDAYQGYHQIFMAKEDAEKTAFVTEKGVYRYNLMPFGLKNAGATYQRLVNRMFKDHIGSLMEVYVDEMLVKNKQECDHVMHLRTAFSIMRSYGMKLNPSKCTFGVRGDNALSSVLVREEDGKQSPVYYVSKMLQGAKKKYIQIKKLALALVTTARKLRPYFQSHPIVVLTNHPLKQVMSRPDTSGRMVKWAVELGEFDIEFQTRSAVKAQVFADFLIELVGEQLNFLATNNEAEYEALIQGLQTAWDEGIRQGDVYTDSQLVAMQVKGTYETREWSMTQYFGEEGVKERKITVMVKSQLVIDEKVVHAVEVTDSWKTPFVRYLKQGERPSDAIAAKRLQFKANCFQMLGDDLYKRTPEGILLIGWLGIPRILVSDNGTQFQGKKIVYLKTRLEGAKGAWVEELPGVLWAYRTTPRTATGETPFCLVYGNKAVIPTEIGEETARVAHYEAERNSQERLFDLTVIEESRDRAYPKILRYKSMMTRNYNRRMRPRSFQVGDLVLKKAEVSKHVGKLNPTWEGPYKVVEIRRKGTYILQDLEGKNLPRPWNVHNLKKFYA